MIWRLLEHLNTAANYVAITGNDDASCGKLALEVGARTGARRVTLGDRGADETALLDRATALLENKTWSADAPWTVSDFWFDELLVRARCNLAPSAVATYELAWRAARSRVVPQKLLVVVGDSELRTHSSQPDRGPVLHLDSSDWARAVEETAAAIQAMS